ncbi:MAG: tRNA (adenosine(37)-N6)-threonylcarbamoyltransferase complex transferase subunit TsaD [Candidatus Omnitrophica bacterium]|nr:tRNA (adenosine(37)-N6)-threonylcarbamoyltransferase complex transferase subunit TsaD [Candidatus Omnitrophota bacterium]
MADFFSLGIETSCDETSASVVCNGRKILSNVVSSSLKEHSKYGGVVPEIACRAQLETISIVVEKAIKDAGINKSELNLIAVTYGPGLVGALLIGISFAKGLSISLNVPLIGVNHLQAHLYGNFFQRIKPEFPYLGLVISGGHTNLVWMKSFVNCKILGETTDDAVGETFDKVARILGLGYPGGPVIEKKAAQAHGDKINFYKSSDSESLNFSFSGLKTAVLYYVKKNPAPVSAVAKRFQSAVGDILILRTRNAIHITKAKQLVLGGGVSVNSYLRKRFADMAREEKVKLFLPDVRLCLDNGAMVAGLGYQLFLKGYTSGIDLSAVPDLEISKVR